MAVHQVEQLLLLDHENQELQEMYNEIAEVSIAGVVLHLSSSNTVAAVLSRVRTRALSSSCWCSGHVLLVHSLPFASTGHPADQGAPQ